MLLRTLLPAAFVLALASGPALAASKSYDLGPFEQVSIGSGLSAVVDIGGGQSVAAESTTDAVLERLDVHVNGSRLEISMRGAVLDWLFNPAESKSLVIHVTAPALSGADSNSGADVDVHQMSGGTLHLSSSSGASLSADGLTGGYVTLDSSSGANLTVKGSCTKLIANSSSGANLDAQGLPCADVSADSSTGGHSSVRATTSINANASSGGGITVYGQPTNANVNSSIGGSVSYAQ